MNTLQLSEVTADHRMFHEVFDVVLVDDIFKPANFCVEVFDKFGRKYKTIYGNVFPKVTDPFNIYSPNIMAHCLMNHMYDMSIVHRQHTMQALVYPWAGLHVNNIVSFVRSELHLLSVANGVVVDGDAGRVFSVRAPVAAKPMVLGNAILKLREQYKIGYRPQKMAQFLERWKSFINTRDLLPTNEDTLSRALEHLAALHDREFEYYPEGVGQVWKIGGKVTIKYRRPNKQVWVETGFGGTNEFNLPTQGHDIVSYVLEAITGAPHNGLMGIHDSTGYAALDGLKERLTYCPDDRMACFIRSKHEFEVVRHDRENHRGILVTAIDHHDQAYLIFVMEKNGVFVRRELHTADRMAVSDFYDVIADFMEVGK